LAVVSVPLSLGNVELRGWGGQAATEQRTPKRKNALSYRRLGDGESQDTFARKHTELSDRPASITPQLNVLGRVHD
jgi:hypothetical protein